MTRAYLSLLQGDLRGAFLFHPLFLFPPIALVIAVPGVAGRRFKTAFWVAMAVVFIAVWIVRMVLLFPHTPPMDFDYKSLIFRILTITHLL